MAMFLFSLRMEIRKQSSFGERFLVSSTRYICRVSMEIRTGETNMLAQTLKKYVV